MVYFLADFDEEFAELEVVFYGFDPGENPIQKSAAGGVADSQPDDWRRDFCDTSTKGEVFIFCNNDAAVAKGMVPNFVVCLIA